MFATRDCVLVLSLQNPIYTSIRHFENNLIFFFFWKGMHGVKLLPSSKKTNSFSFPISTKILF